MTGLFGRDIEPRIAIPPIRDDAERARKLGNTGLSLVRLVKGNQLDQTPSVIEEVLAEGIKLRHVKLQLPFHITLLHRWESRQKAFADLPTDQVETELRTRAPWLNKTAHLDVEDVAMVQLPRSTAPRRTRLPMPVLAVKFALSSREHLFTDRRRTRGIIRDMSPIDFGPADWDPDEWSVILRLAKISQPYLSSVTEDDIDEIAATVPSLQLDMTHAVNANDLEL